MSMIKQKPLKKKKKKQPQQHDDSIVWLRLLLHA